MVKEQYDQLKKIYNTFCLVSTKGEDTIIMGQALNAFRLYLQEIAATAMMPPQSEFEEEEKELQ